MADYNVNYSKNYAMDYGVDCEDYVVHDPPFKLVGECVKALALIIFCIVGTHTRPVSYTLS